MEIKIDRKTGLPGTFNLKTEPTIEDKIDAYALKFWKENRCCESCSKPIPDSYGALKRLWEAQEKVLIFSGMVGIKTEEKRKLSEIKWAVLSGYMEARGVIDQMISYVEMNKDQQNLQENNMQTGGGNDGKSGFPI